MRKLILFLLVIFIFISCNLLDTIIEDETFEITDWTDETHSDLVDPNYDIVFNQDDVMVINITIDSDDWEIMYDDLEENLSSSRTIGMSDGLDSSYTPVWVPSTVTVDDTDWYKVGIRFKGNSSLQTAYNSGNGKLSFKLDFNEFEERYTIIEGQRFYGFRQLNLNNNYDDESLLREKVGADLFREFGLVSAQTRFCAVYVDYGSGKQYFGLYTMVEEIDDTAIETQLGDDSGNIYKPDGDAASFSSGTYDEDEFNKKNNEDLDDYSDVLELYNIINSSTRESDVESWRSDLEEILDVDIFLKWLAANSTIQNWDTYGNMTHNYYLYNDDGLLNWIPWDNNEAFQDGKLTTYDLAYSVISDDWPLILYLLDDEEYSTIYREYLADFVGNVFIESDMEDLYDTYYDLIVDYVYAEESGYTYLESDYDFDNAIDDLKDHVTERNSTVTEYLSE